jgi:hypothetical protein
VRRFFVVVLFGTLAVAIGCGGGSGGSSTSKTTTPPPAQNVQPIAVDGGPAAFVKVNGSYANGAFTTITVCAPGSTTSCNTIDHVLVDTGSFGLRILSSSSGGELTVPLPKSSIAGNSLAECIQFADNSFLWGPVETADVKIAGEQASSLPVNVVGDATFSAGSPVPSSCSNSGGPDDDNLNALGANGILGVGFVQYDCGSACVSGTPPAAAYYQCPASGCVPSLVSLTQQVQNPISLFTSDNNGVIIQLPAATAPEASLAGSMVFGIGTQSDNALGSATVLTLDSTGSFTTTFNGIKMTASFIDSGSNGLFFDDSSLTKCPVNTFFYCPANPTNLSAVNTGANGVNSTVTFTVTNADNAFNTFPSDAVFPGLAGQNDGTFTSFDFGLPFFYGRNVFTSIASTTAAPYWAY